MIPCTLGEALTWLTHHLSDTSPTARMDAEVLIAHTLDCTRAFLLAYPETLLKDTQKEQLMAYSRRRQAGEPIAYLLGTKDFWSLTFCVTPDTLIPRPETEHLIEWALMTFDTNPSVKIADLGTGSGAIAVTLAHEKPQWIIHASDQSAAALTIAKQNAAQHQCARINFYQGNWCDALPDQDYDAIIANPPYIADNDPHLNALLFEPKSALVAAQSGLADLHTIIQHAHAHLKPRGWLALEHGADQSDAVQQLLATHHYQAIHTHRDLAGHPRFTTAQRIVYNDENS